MRAVCLCVSVPDVSGASIYAEFQCAVQVVMGGGVYGWSDVAERDLWW